MVNKSKLREKTKWDVCDKHMYKNIIIIEKKWINLVQSEYSQVVKIVSLFVYLISWMEVVNDIRPLIDIISFNTDLGSLYGTDQVW